VHCLSVDSGSPQRRHLYEHVQYQTESSENPGKHGTAGVALWRLHASGSEAAGPEQRNMLLASCRSEVLRLLSDLLEKLAGGVPDVCAS